MKRWTTSALLVALACTFGLLGGWIVTYLRPALASRNSSGTYSVFAGTTPVVSLQTIGSSLWNNAWNDMASSMTDSLDRNGRGGMLAALRGVDGTVAAPAFSYTSETGSGEYRIGAGDLGWAISGAKKLELTSSLFTVTPDALLSGKLGIGSSATYPLDVQGAVNTDVNARFVSSGAMPLFVVTGATIARIGFNLRDNGTNALYDTSSGGAVVQGEPGTSAVVVYTAPTGGTGGNTATLTERMRIDTSGVKIGAIGTAMGSLQVKSGVSGCATAASAGATCNTTVTWLTTFGDTSYTVYCSGIGVTSGTPVQSGIAKNATNAVFTTAAVTASAAQFTTIECVGFH